MNKVLQEIIATLTEKPFCALDGATLLTGSNAEDAPEVAVVRVLSKALSLRIAEELERVGREMDELASFKETCYPFEIGASVRDKFTGFTGVVLALHKYLQGWTATVQPLVNDRGDAQKPEVFDCPRLELVEVKK